MLTKPFNRPRRDSSGFTLIEILVALVITSVIAAIAIPMYTSSRTHQYLSVALNDGDALSREVQAVFTSIKNIGSTDGTINLDAPAQSLTITLGAGGDILPAMQEKVSNGTTATGVVYASSSSWCLDVANNGQHAIFDQQGLVNGGKTCTISGLSYPNSTFAMGSNNQVLQPSAPIGGRGTITYAITAGTLPIGVTFNAATGAFTGPSATLWNFNAAAVSSGGNYTCALTTAGGVKCWGDNSVGQLGTGTLTSQTIPTDVVGLTSGVTSIFASPNGTTCAILTSGSVDCWGNNSTGQIGDGTTTNRQVPTPVPSLGSSISSIAIGDSSSCALATTGAVKCWGSNSNGQLGNGSNTSSLVPVSVTGYSSSGASAISLGGTTACLITSSGGAKCWGNNADGNIGDSTQTNRTTPTQVSSLNNGVSSISVGDHFACAIVASGKVKCWGDDSSGQLGDNGNGQSLRPVFTQGLTGVTKISNSGDNACVLDSNGYAWCWGNNGESEDGDGEESDHSSMHTPTHVNAFPSGAAQISVSKRYSCAINAVEALTCWGTSPSDGKGANATAPADVPGTGPQPGFPTTITVTATNGTGSTSTQVTLTAS